MTCEEMVYSGEYADYILNYLSGYEGGSKFYEGGCVTPIIDKIAIAHLPLSSEYLTNLESVPYVYIPKLYGLMDSVNLDVSGVTNVQSEYGMSLDGENVIIGIVDTGIDWTSSRFYDLSGEEKISRIGVIWNQEEADGNHGISVKGLEKSDVMVPYGSIYTGEMITRALNETQGETRRIAGDENGHGTFLAGVAAGGVDEAADVRGIAPRAELAVVRLKECKHYLREYFGILEDVPAYEESDIIYAVHFLVQYARRAGKPISILLGVGSSNGGHSGQTFLDHYLNTVLENVDIMVSVPAGNEGNERLHYSSRLRAESEPEEVEFNVASNQQSLVMELWGRRPTTFAIGIEAPGGERIWQIPPRFGSEEILSFPVSKTKVYVAYQLVETYTGDELIFIRLVNPTPGVWRLFVYADTNKTRTFDLWLPLRQFLREDTYFLRPEPQNTVTNPGNSRHVMTLTAYNHANGGIYAESGRGVGGQTQIKPDLAAPGVNVMGPGTRDNYVRKSGTSVAAAHSAGMLAQFLQWSRENPEVGYFYAPQIQSLFQKNAVRDTEISYPNPVWGYGIMNVEKVFDDFRVTGL